jgi:transposase
VLRFHFNWKRLSMAAALAYRFDGGTSRLVFATRAGAYDDAGLIEFLTQLRRHLRGDKATLIWDGLPSHRSRAMRTFLATQRHWLVIEALPAYAPDLNPVEALWGNLKGQELANLCADTLDETLAKNTYGNSTCESGRVRNTSRVVSSSAQIRLTSDLEIPDSNPSAATRSSTLRVETPWT